MILASKEGGRPDFTGVEDVLANKGTDVKIFNKPTTRPYRRMAVVLCNDKPDANVEQVKDKAVTLSKQIQVIQA